AGEVLHADAKELGQLRHDALDRVAPRAVERAITEMANAQLPAEVMTRHGAPPGREAEIVALERAREIRPGDGAVLDRLSGSFPARDVDARGFADEQDARSCERGAWLEAALRELLEPVA